jgi:hypothetical protein
MDFNVIQKTRDLVEYVLTVTHKSPKEFRFSLVSKLHGYVLSAMENILRANELNIHKEGNIERRKAYQLEAMTSFYMLGYMSDIARTQQCILPKQYEQISEKLFECRKFLGAWVKSDEERIKMNNAKKQQDVVSDKEEIKDNLVVMQDGIPKP